MNGLLKIVLYDPSGRGGICHYTFQLAESLAQAGCDVTVMAPEGYELNELPRSFKLSILFKKSLLKCWLIKMRCLNGSSNSSGETAQLPSQAAPKESRKPPVAKFLKCLRLRIIFLRAAVCLLWDRPHLIHFQWLADRKGDLFFIKLLKWCGFKIVYTAHDLLPHDKDTVENRRLFQSIYSQADRLIVHAENIKQEMIRMFDVDPNKVSVIPHGSNALFFTSSVSKQAARTYLNIPLNKKVILFFGLIKPYKGLEYLVQAFSQIKEQVQDAMLLIAGRIADEDHATYKRYAELLSQLCDKDSTKCITEYVLFDDIRYFFSAADIVVLPHVKPSQSGVLLLAVAAGKPVVVTDAGGLSELVENGRSGFVVSPKDSKALAEASIKILNTRGLLERMSREAKMLADTTYAWDTIASTTIKLYQTLNSPGPVGAGKTRAALKQT